MAAGLAASAAAVLPPAPRCDLLSDASVPRAAAAAAPRLRHRPQLPGPAARPRGRDPLCHALPRAPAEGHLVPAAPVKLEHEAWLRPRQVQDRTRVLAQRPRQLQGRRCDFVSCAVYVWCVARWF